MQDKPQKGKPKTPFDFNSYMMGVRAMIEKELHDTRRRLEAHAEVIRRARYGEKIKFYQFTCPQCNDTIYDLEFIELTILEEMKMCNACFEREGRND